MNDVGKDFIEFYHRVVQLRESITEYEIDDEDKVHNRYDKGYKYLLSVKKNFVEFVKTFMKISLAEEITEDNIRLMDKEFITPNFEKRESDLIYEVKNGDRKIYFILLEIQSKVDKKMPYRILNYMIEIWRKVEINYYEEDKFKLPKIIPCVLYNGRSRWTAPIEFKDLYEDVGENLEYLVNFKYILVDVHRYRPEYLLELSNVISSAFYLDSAAKKNIDERLEKLAKNLITLDDTQIAKFKNWVIKVMALNEKQYKIMEKGLEKKGEEEFMGLAEVSREIYEDGMQEGAKRQKEKMVEVLKNIREISKKNGKIEEITKEGEDMRLAEVSREIYEDGIEEGKKRQKEKAVEVLKNIREISKKNGTIEELTKEGENMSLAEVSREIYEDGIQEGEKRQKEKIIKKMLVRKLKEENSKINILFETASSEKLDEIEDKIFEITSWKEVEDVLLK